MSKALVTCPATSTTELVEYVATPLGPLLHSCTRFHPTTALACGRACARGARCDLAETTRCASDADTGLDPDTDVDIDVPVRAHVPPAGE